MRRILYVSIIVIVAVVAFFSGYFNGLQDGERIGKAIGYLDGLKAYPKKLRFFDNLTELKQFIKEDDTDKYLYIPEYFDCDDFAIMLQVRALQKGYILNIALVDSDGDRRPDHVVNLAYLNTKQYVLIDPQTDEMIVINDTPEIGINYYWPEVEID